MNYIKIYNNIIKNAKSKKIIGYTEKHHIIPKCIGGNDDIENISKLSAREHFICHLLLTKIYPESKNLILAATMMCVSGKYQNDRINNRRYEWLRKKHANVMQIMQQGKNNSQYGTCWISNISEELSIKIPKSELNTWINLGWIKKRIMNFEKYKKSLLPKKRKKRDNTCNIERMNKDNNNIHEIANNFNIVKGAINQNILFIEKCINKKIAIRSILHFLKVNDSGGNYITIKNIKQSRSQLDGVLATN